MLAKATFAQLGAGDIMFTGFNADGDDNVAFLALEDIPANTTIYFTDSEWDGTAFGTDENDFTWVSGASTISAGTVIKIDGLDATISTSHGSVTGGTGLSKNGDALFAYTGTALRQPTSFLTAIANTPSAYGNLNGTGLIEGLTATTLADITDIAEYVGPTSGIDKNGYLSYFNDLTNWVSQDTGADDQNDGIAPDLPFTSTSFTFSTTDVTAPFVANVSVVNQTSIAISFSEPLDVTSATTLGNYTFSPAITISNANYDAITNTVTLTHAGLNNGISTSITIDNISDVNNNAMTNAFVSGNFFYNVAQPNLVFSEIMYNAPSSNSDNLEFIEVYNAGSNAVALGGLVVSDEGNFAFSFPEMDLAAGNVVLLATDKSYADNFYNANFLSLTGTPANLLGNGGELLQIKNTAGQLITEVEYDDATPWDANADGLGYSLEYLNTNLVQNDGTSWITSSNLVGVEQGDNIFATPGSYTETFISYLSFIEEFVTASENQGTVDVEISLNSAPSTDVTVDVNLIPGIGNITPNFTTQSITFPANSSASQTLTISITDDATTNNDGFFALELSNLNGGQVGALGQTVVYVIDNDETVPTSTGDLNINYLTSYEVAPGESAEIVAFDEDSDRLFVLNATATQVEILDFSDPSNITSIASIDMTAYGAGATSVAVQNGVVAATVDVPNFGNGKVVFMDTDGNLLNSVEVGNLPDMVCFTPDGTKVLTANEGQPNDGYTIDPEGTISIIDITGGVANLTQADVNTINFNTFDAQEAQLKAAGVRIFGAGSSVSQDMEPEYITVNANSTKAWVSLQENNAIATIDLVTEEITEILPLGTKDHSLLGNGLDISDKTDSVAIMNWNVKGMYMPDAIATYTVNGIDYIVTANEGDQREYGVIDEDVSVGDSGYDLDPTLFPNAALLKEDFLLGRIAASPYDGDTDGDGDIDEIHIFGARSFSIWNATTGELVYDSGDEFERITANDPIYGSLFNVSNSNNNFKNRSDNKGPEPEGITVHKINNDFYAFVTLERTGGMMVYNITNPAQAAFVKYANSRDLGANEGGDLGPEGIIYIPENESPNNTAMIIMANEVSATLSIYTVENLNHSGLENNSTEAGLMIYPNPTTDYLYFNAVTTGVIVNAMGQEVISFQNKAYLNIDQLEKGIYYLKTEATTVNFIVR